MEISAKEIEDLEPPQFIDFINSLINAEAHLLGIPTTKLKLNSYITHGDGGVDGRIDDLEKHGNNEWIPSGLSVWQFKTDRSHTNASPSKLKEEASKERVLQALRAGGRYVVAIARICDDPMRSERENALRDTIKANGCNPNLVTLLTADDLKRWAVKHYSLLLLPFFMRPFGECLRMEKWELDSLQRGTFVTDPRRQEIIDKLSRFVGENGSPLHKRIFGQRGIGKTRVVMEALRLPGIRSRVIYIPQPESIPSDFWPFLREKTESTTILAVDECEEDEVSRLKQQADACEGRVRLITIGTGDIFLSEQSENYLSLGRLDDAAIHKILETQFTSLSPTQIDWVVRLTAGFVRLTVTCAEAIAKNPSIDLTQLTRVPEINRLLDFLLPETSERKVMQALSLLTRVGFEEQVISEGKALASFVEVPWSEFASVAERMRHRGLVNRKGRYRYVTPTLLAAWLAAEIWSARTDEVRTLLATLPTQESKDAFLERIKDLGADERTQVVIRALLSEKNLRSIDQLDDERTSKIFSMLALADPKPALNSLERLFEWVTIDRISNFVAGRRNIVYALDYIKWFKDTFFGASRILLALAEAENETFGNNATGIWEGLFRVHLGGTEVPAIDRIPILEETLGSSSPARRVLALKAIAASMALHEIRGSGIESNGTRPVPAEWHPRTYGEIWEVYRKMLQLVDRAMRDEVPEVSKEARKVTIQSARAITAIGLADEAIDRLEVLKPQNADDHRELRDAVRTILEYETKILKVPQKERLIAIEGKLAGDSYHDRLRRWVGRWSFGDWTIQKREGDASPQARAAELAEEVIKNPTELQSELDWLVSDEAQNVGFFGRRLGELDQNHVFLNDLVTKSRRHSQLLLGTYLGGRNAAGDRETVARLLDQWTETDEQLADSILIATSIMEPSHRNLVRILQLRKKGWIQIGPLTRLVWTGWAEKLPTNDLHDFLECLLAENDKVSTEAALSLLTRRLSLSPADAEILAPSAWKALAQNTSLQGNMAQYYWREVSKHYEKIDPVKLSDIVLELYKDENSLFHQDDDVMQALSEATKLKPREIWNKVSDVLLRKDRAAYRLLLGLQYWYVRIFESNFLLEWAEKRKPDGPQLLSSLTVPAGVPMDQLTRQLLIKYGHDDRVRDQLYSNYLTGAFTGSMTAWLKNKMEIAQQWTSDSDGEVAKWARSIVNSLSQQIAKSQTREEEEDLI
jgi:hypothetical protein